MRGTLFANNNPNLSFEFINFSILIKKEIMVKTQLKIRSYLKKFTVQFAEQLNKLTEK